VRALLDDGRIPVIATVAGGPGGMPYNINADTAAAALAVPLQVFTDSGVGTMVVPDPGGLPEPRTGGWG
jgi:acetylglutamate kinase